MSPNEIYKYYENKIEKIESDEAKDILYQKLEDLDAILRDIEDDIKKAIDEQNEMKYPDYDYQSEADWFNYLNCI